MFCKQATIHHPDSKRNMNLKQWIFDKEIRVQNKYIEHIGTNIQLDLFPINDQIAEGLIYVKYDHHNNVLNLIYKQPEGIYGQQGFISGHIKVPLPELYVQFAFDVRYRDGMLRTSTTIARIASKYLMMLPLSNLYDRNLSSDNFPDEPLVVTDICHGHTMDNMIGACESITEIINKCSNNIATFLMSNGNADLNLYDERARLADGTISSNARKLAQEITSYEDHRTNEYMAYWMMLHLLAKTHTPNEIYQKLLYFDDIDQIENEFLINSSDILNALYEHNRSSNELVMYDEDDDDDDY